MHRNLELLPQLERNVLRNERPSSWPQYKLSPLKKNPILSILSLKPKDRMSVADICT